VFCSDKSAKVRAVHTGLHFKKFIAFLSRHPNHHLPGWQLSDHIGGWIAFIDPGFSKQRHSRFPRIDLINILRDLDRRRGRKRRSGLFRD
jgi:hypothetical protein